MCALSRKTLAKNESSHIMLRNKLFVGYLVLIHLAVAVGVVRFVSNRMPKKDAEITDVWRRTLSYHKSHVELVPDGSVLFFGDSITQSLPVFLIADKGINFGIGRDTTRGLLERIGDYSAAIDGSDALVFAIGVNDKIFRSPQDAIAIYEELLDRVTAYRAIVCKVLPVAENSEDAQGYKVFVDEFNQRLDAIAGERGLIVVDVPELRTEDGWLRPEVTTDGVHLNSTGNRIYAEAIETEIKRQLE